MSTQVLVPPDDEAVFSGHQTLRVSASLRASRDPLLVQLLPGASIQEERDVPEELGPEFSRVLSEGAGAFEDLPKHLQQEADSAGLSDSDLEFFDCRQGFSDSDPEDAKRPQHAYCRVSEPPSPTPGSGLKRGRQRGAHLRGLASQQGQGLGEVMYDSEAEAPVYEELPSRDQAGYCDDADANHYLGRVSGGAWRSSFEQSGCGGAVTASHINHIYVA